MHLLFIAASLSFYRPQTQNRCILQDAHEFLNFLLNELVDILEKEHKAVKESLSNHSSQKTPNGQVNDQANGSHEELAATLVHKCFQVRLYSFLQTCLCCVFVPMACFWTPKFPLARSL
jgi:hypothetical protein